MAADAAGERAPRGSVYGLAVRSAAPLRYLRHGAGSPTLHVSVEDDGVRPAGEPLRRWLPRPDNPFRAELWQEGTTYRLHIHGLGWYRIAPEVPAVAMPPEAAPLRREERLYGIPLALVLARQGAVPLHAATVQIGGAAVALAAPGRHGKTTLAAALASAGHRVLAEDVSCVRLGPDPAVLPGPALLRVRRDAFERLRIPGATVTTEDEDRIHLALAEGDRGGCDPVPLRAVLLLRPADGPPSIERVEPALAIRDLWALSTKLPTEQDRARCFTALAELADRVPAYDLRRPQRWELLQETVERVVEVAA